MEEIFNIHSDLFSLASSNHPFILGCKDGSINPLQFNIWFLQDYKFMSFYIDFIKNLTLIAPDVDKSFWEEKAAVATHAMSDLMITGITKSGLSLNGLEYPETTRMIEYLKSLQETRSYAIQVFAHFLFLKVYEEPWEYLRYFIVNGIQSKNDRSKFDQKITLNPGFKQMLDHIESMAMREMKSGACDFDEASLVFENIMKLEIDFWHMAMENGRLEDFN